MAIKYDKIEQGLKIATGTGAPVHAATAGDRYTDIVTGFTYTYTTSWTSLLSVIPQANKIYVDSVNGVDSTGRGNINTPYLTPEYALADITNTGTITANTATNTTLSAISDIDNANLEIGMYVSGTGIPFGTIIVAKGNQGGDANTVTLSRATTATSVALTITYTKFYTLRLNGDFTVTGNLYKQGFDYDFGDSNVYFTGIVFTKTPKSFLRFNCIGGNWYGKSNTATLFTTSAGDNTVTINFKLKSYYSEGTGYQINSQENGVSKFKHIYIECSDFRAQFGKVASTEGVSYTSGGTITFIGNFYGLLEGVRTRYGVFNLLGNIETPTAVNALHFSSSSCSINGSIRGSVYNFMRGTLNGEVIGTNFIAAASSYSTPSIINASLNCTTVTINSNCFAIFNGQILGNVINSGADVTINNMIGSYTGSGAGKAVIRGSSDVGLALTTVTVSGTHELTIENSRYMVNNSTTLTVGTGCKVFNKNYFRGRVLSVSGELINDGEMFTFYKIDVGGIFKNNNYVLLSNSTTETASNTATLNVTTGGIFIQNGGKLECDSVISKSGLIRKSGDNTKVIFKGQPQLKVANGLAPLQILSNVGTAQDVMNFGCITNGAVGFRLSDTFTDTTYGTAYAPNGLVGGTNYEDTTYDF